MFEIKALTNFSSIYFQLTKFNERKHIIMEHQEQVQSSQLGIDSLVKFKVIQDCRFKFKIKIHKAHLFLNKVNYLK